MKMAILSKSHSDTGGFTIINNKVLQDSRLSTSAKGIFALLMSMKDGWNVNISILKAYSTDGRKSIGNSLAELENIGYIRRYKVYENGRIADWIYEITDYR
jgi:hypothetical protein